MTKFTLIVEDNDQSITSVRITPSGTMARFLAANREIQRARAAEMVDPSEAGPTLTDDQIAAAILEGALIQIGKFIPSVEAGDNELKTGVRIVVTDPDAQPEPSLTADMQNSLVAPVL